MTRVRSCCCALKGYHYSPRCQDRVCDHRKRTPTHDTETGTVTFGPRVMECPQRPCGCELGKPFREAVAERLLAQDKRLAMWGSQ